MMGKFKKYEDCVPSNIEWIGEIPFDWEIQKVKNLFSLITRPAPKNNKEELLSVYTDIGVRPRKDLIAKGNKASTTDNYWMVQKGDIIVNKLLAWMGAIGISNYDGVTSPAYDILRHKKEVNPKFYNYLFRNIIIRHELKRHSKGIMDMRLRLYFDQFGQIRVPLPPITEQNSIVKFIDKKTTQIDHCIQLKEKTIALLQERKAAIINQAVTKGLDPTVEMKDSGIEWLGEIPKHWEVKRLRYVGQCQNGISESGDFFGHGYPFVSYGDVYKNIELPLEVSGLANSSTSNRKHFSVLEGDIFFTRTSETMEEIGLTSTCMKTIENATFAGFLIRFRPKEKYLVKGFSKYYFRSLLHRAFFVKEMNLVIRASLSQELLKRLPVILPNLKQQQKIADFLDEKTTKIDLVINNAKKEITLIKEYRESLISAAVTGKIDVRS